MTQRSDYDTLLPVKNQHELQEFYPSPSGKLASASYQGHTFQDLGTAISRDLGMQTKLAAVDRLADRLRGLGNASNLEASLTSWVNAQSRFKLKPDVGHWAGLALIITGLAIGLIPALVYYFVKYLPIKQCDQLLSQRPHDLWQECSAEERAVCGDDICYPGGYRPSADWESGGARYNQILTGVLPGCFGLLSIGCGMYGLRRAIVGPQQKRRAWVARVTEDYPKIARRLDSLRDFLQSVGSYANEPNVSKENLEEVCNSIDAVLEDYGYPTLSGIDFKKTVVDALRGEPHVSISEAVTVVFTKVVSAAVSNHNRLFEEAPYNEYVNAQAF